MPIEDDALQHAADAGLKYFSDTQPGFTRVRSGKSFRYLDNSGKTLKDKTHLKRIKSLVIPPAWTNVWISPLSNSHLQVTGKDQRGRKTYMYHTRWDELRNLRKYDNLLEFGQTLPRLRSQVRKHLRLRGLPREKILATVVQLMEESLIRIGNKVYARENESYGLTTIRKKHVEVKGERIRFSFRGKSGVYRMIDIENSRVAKVIRQCEEIPGYELFKYFDENGEARALDSGDVNEYLKEVTGKEFTAKYFRTWAGSVRALEAYREFLDEGVDDISALRIARQVVKSVSGQLGNTQSVCRSYYIHPRVFFLIEKNISPDFELKRKNSKLSPAENYMLSLLKKRILKGPGGKVFKL